MSKITKDDVQRVALLSRIEMSDAEVQQFQVQLERILEYMDKLNELDTENIEPMASVMGLSDALREDEVKPSLACEQALANAPERTADSFKVPAMVE
jgi:aspartyl-tRNA(Asn)/glutamyl-tRNA(Gln) amidotransferase subunit C